MSSDHNFKPVTKDTLLLHCKQRAPPCLSIHYRVRDMIFNIEGIYIYIYACKVSSWVLICPLYQTSQPYLNIGWIWESNIHSNSLYNMYGCMQGLISYCFVMLHLNMPWWRHQWKHFLRYWPFVAGNSPVNSEFPSQSLATRSLVFSLICTWTNSWVNNRYARDLRRSRAQYDAIVMPKKWIVSASARHAK